MLEMNILLMLSVLPRRCGPNSTFAGWDSLHYAYAIQYLLQVCRSCQLFFTSPTYSAPLSTSSSLLHLKGHNVVLSPTPKGTFEAPKGNNALWYMPSKNTAHAVTIIKTSVKRNARQVLYRLLPSSK